MKVVDRFLMSLLSVFGTAQVGAKSDRSKIDETTLARARDSKFDVQSREPPRHSDNGVCEDRRTRIEGDGLTIFACVTQECLRMHLLSRFAR